jgi:pimeloyl-ACP methyl ester carboxylesterase/class 3 adenylate cyclase
MDVPDTRYAKSGDVSIAYQVTGDGPFDVVYVPGFVSNVDHGWEEPSLARFYERLASFSRLILFDKRGTGLSDRVKDVPTLETRMDDVRAVMDAVGSQRAAIMGVSEGGPMTVMFAATYPDRAFAAVLYGSPPRYVWAPDYPWGATREEYRRDLEETERRWGTHDYSDELLEWLAPSVAGDHDFKRWFRSHARLSASPGAARDLERMNMEIDVRHVLPAIRVPTLVLNRTDDRADRARYVAAHIPGAQYVELPGRDHAPWVGNADAVVDAVREFVTSVWEERSWEEAEPDRVLSTVLFTDIVSSSEKAASLGDRAWRDLLERHHSLVRRQLVRFRGREVDTAGDGFFASFDGPARAIRCGCAIAAAMPALGLEVRVGLHTGECELMDGKVAGIAVNTGARVAANAEPGEVLVSSTVKDLVAGSGLAFADRGAHELKGIPGEWRLYSVVK